MKKRTFGMVIGLAFFMLYCHSPNPIITNDASNWLGQLPSCPCENPDIKKNKLGDGWAIDQGSISKYHQGATTCIRSYPPVKTSEGMSSQQCCYDSKGKLITNGSGAGTPDKESTCDNEDAKGYMTLRLSGVIGHFNKDVKPWESFGGVDSGWVKYNLYWIPNNGNKCKVNVVGVR